MFLCSDWDEWSAWQGPGVTRPSSKDADEFQSYEWHFVARAWGTWDCLQMAQLLVKTARQEASVWRWFTAKQVKLLHYTLQRFELLADFYPSGIPQSALTAAAAGRALLTVDPTRCETDNFMRLG